MATARLTLRNKPNKENLYAIVILIVHKNSNTEIATKVAIDKKFWDSGRIMRNCPQVENVRMENIKLSGKLNEVYEFIEELEEKRRIDSMSAKQIADYVKKGGTNQSDRDFLAYMEEYLAKIPNQSTREKYAITLNVLKTYTKHLFFSDITKPWLYRFKEWRLNSVAPATTNIDLRNIRAVINRAIDVDEIIGQELYAFRKFDFAKAEPRNLRLPIKKLKEIRDYNTTKKIELLAIDFFMLSFYLIGMNNSDIYSMEGVTEGRVEYTRNKTSKQYSIKVEPEALEIIERRKGFQKFLIYQERYGNARNLTKQINKHLKKVGKVVGVPDLKMYHARHSWAGIAARKPIGATKALIGQALGHGRITVTDTYFDYDNELVDDLNRKVLDLLLI